MKELAQRRCSLDGRDRLAMSCSIAGVLDETRLGRKRLTNERSKRWLGKMRCQRRFVGILQCPVMAVQPGNRGLQRQPAVKRGATRVSLREILRTRHMTEDVRKLGLQKRELRHRGLDLGSANLAGVVSQL